MYSNRGRKTVERTNPGSPSKRWSTTTNSALADTAAQVLNIDRGQMVKDLADRKKVNTKTSISFGNEKVSYISDAAENQQKILNASNADDRHEQLLRLKTMKTALTTTNFCLGDEMPEYKSSNQASMEAAAHATLQAGNSARGQSNNELKEAIKKSSIHFGQEKTNYQSVAHESMEYHGNQNSFEKLRDDIKEMTATLRKHNFSFGDEEVEYKSDYQRGFGSVPLDSYRDAGRNRAGINASIAEARKCHFSLGLDKVKYMSNAHSAMNLTDGHKPGDMARSIENAKAMKTALQKTSIVIGDDKDYM